MNESEAAVGKGSYFVSRVLLLLLLLLYLGWNVSMFISSTSMIEVLPLEYFLSVLL